MSTITVLKLPVNKAVTVNVHCVGMWENGVLILARGIHNLEEIIGSFDSDFFF